MQILARQLWVENTLTKPCKVVKKKRIWKTEGFIIIILALPSEGQFIYI